jgi:hypothetical protein
MVKSKRFGLEGIGSKMEEENNGHFAYWLLG